MAIRTAIWTLLVLLWCPQSESVQCQTEVKISRNGISNGNWNLISKFESYIRDYNGNGINGYCEGCSNTNSWCVTLRMQGNIKIVGYPPRDGQYGPSSWGGYYDHGHYSNGQYGYDSVTVSELTYRSCDFGLTMQERDGSWHGWNCEILTKTLDRHRSEHVCRRENGYDNGWSGSYPVSTCPNPWRNRKKRHSHRHRGQWSGYGQGGYPVYTGRYRPDNGYRSGRPEIHGQPGFTCSRYPPRNQQCRPMPMHCTQKPYLPGCHRPPDYCSHYPYNPMKPPTSEYCMHCPDDPKCRSLPAPDYCNQYPSRPTPSDYCTRCPDEPRCRSRPPVDYCNQYPYSPAPSEYCNRCPDEPRCRSRPPVDYCNQYQYRPHPSDYCTRCPDDPRCRSRPPVDYCNQYPYSPAPSEYCNRCPDEPRCYHRPPPRPRPPSGPPVPPGCSICFQWDNLQNIAFATPHLESYGYQSTLRPGVKMILRSGTIQVECCSSNRCNNRPSTYSQRPYPNTPCDPYDQRCQPFGQQIHAQCVTNIPFSFGNGRRDMWYGGQIPSLPYPNSTTNRVQHDSNGQFDDLSGYSNPGSAAFDLAETPGSENWDTDGQMGKESEVIDADVWNPVPNPHPDHHARPTPEYHKPDARPNPPDPGFHPRPTTNPDYRKPDPGSDQFDQRPVQKPREPDPESTVPTRLSLPPIPTPSIGPKSIGPAGSLGKIGPDPVRIVDPNDVLSLVPLPMPLRNEASKDEKKN